MEDTFFPTSQAYPHVRIVMGMVVGLGIARLLGGVARIIQHPGQVPLYPVHLAWVASVLLMLVHYWWWEFGLFTVPRWTFEVYLFVLAYAVLLFLLSTLLFPDSMHDYDGYESFFISRRRWFFGLMATTYVFDVVDTLIKGRVHLDHFGVEYLIRIPVFLVLCVVAALTANRRFHAVFVTFTLVYQVSWILRLFDTLD
ncbi:MAG: hypothetical protein K5872_02830 [Rhizobiaceae bacterium]|nr:hypothetical protein [Rhizobiaceae bacterium]MCV0405144.1 hypothetical protein [Rhizobiaceae bacterium]